MIDFADYSFATIFVGGLALFVVATELGHYVGARARSPGTAGATTLEAAMLGLLALIIGFTFSMALTRYDARRDAVLREANAIGTAALRASLLPAPFAMKSLTQLEEYTAVRAQFAERAPTPAEFSAAIARSNDLQQLLWAGARGVMEVDKSMVGVGLYIQALNEVFDDQESRVTAARNRVPTIVIAALYGIGIVTMSFAGFVGSGRDKAPWRISTYTMCLLLAAVMLLIEDINRPTAGFFTVSQQPVLDTLGAIQRLIAAGGA